MSKCPSQLKYFHTCRNNKLHFYLNYLNEFQVFLLFTTSFFSPLTVISFLHHSDKNQVLNCHISLFKLYGSLKSYIMCSKHSHVPNKYGSDLISRILKHYVYRVKWFITCGALRRDRMLSFHEKQHKMSGRDIPQLRLNPSSWVTVMKRYSNTHRTWITNSISFEHINDLTTIYYLQLTAPLLFLRTHRCRRPLPPSQ